MAYYTSGSLPYGVTLNAQAIVYVPDYYAHYYATITPEVTVTL
jgi:streptogramin lyase